MNQMFQLTDQDLKASIIAIPNEGKKKACLKNNNLNREVVDFSW